MITTSISLISDVLCLHTRGLNECPLVLVDPNSILVNSTHSPVSVPSRGFLGTVWIHSWSHPCSFTSFLYSSCNLFCYMPVSTFWLPYLSLQRLSSTLAVKFSSHVWVHRHAQTYFPGILFYLEFFLIWVLSLFMLFFLPWTLVFPFLVYFFKALRFPLFIDLTNIIPHPWPHQLSFRSGLPFLQKLLSSPRGIWLPPVAEGLIPFPGQRGSARAILL